MAISIADCERELRDASVELEQVREQLQELRAREAELMRVVGGWEAIIEATKRKQGITVIPARQHSVPTSERTPESNIRIPNVEDEDGVNKSQFVRDQILANATNGVTTDDLKRAAAASGISHAPSWPYGVLARLKKHQKIVKRRGRFYPTDLLQRGAEEDQASLTLN